MQINMAVVVVDVVSVVVFCGGCGGGCRLAIYGCGGGCGAYDGGGRGGGVGGIRWWWLQ